MIRFVFSPLEMEGDRRGVIPVDQLGEGERGIVILKGITLSLHAALLICRKLAIEPTCPSCGFNFFSLGVFWQDRLGFLK